MRTLIVAIVLGSCLVAPTFGQNVFYQENFNTGIPASWTQIFMGFAEPWYWANPGVINGSPDIYYEWFCNIGFLFRDTIILSPPIDLSGLTNATFQCEQNQLLPLSRVYNGVKVTTNNGASYTEIYQETGTWTGNGTIQVSLNAYAGQPNVRLAFHYQGAIANEWRIDDVQILTTNPIFAVAGLAANQTAAFTVSGAAPGNQLLIGFSLTGAGPISTPYGNVNLTEPAAILATLVANGAGQALYLVLVPGGTTGVVVYMQAAEVNPGGSLDLSNSLVRTVQ
jgi:hypothetical protein